MTLAAERVEMIRQRLQQALSPLCLEIVDDSHKHAGHAGARSGGGHFSVMLVSDMFTGKPLLQRHRLVYDALADRMVADIHALSIRAYTPLEFNSASS